MRNREAIIQALAKRLEAIPGIKTFSRKLKLWADVGALYQPALFMSLGSQNIEIQGRGLSPILHLSIELYLYNQNRDISQQNNLLDAIEQALEPDPHEETLTLGGLVHHCRIEGQIETDEGLLGEQAVAIIPISILAP